MKPDLFWIPGPWNGRLAIMARPRGGDWLEDEANAWQQAGLEVIVSLLEPEEVVQLGLDGEQSSAEGRQLRFISFPIADRSVPRYSGSASTLIDNLHKELESGRTVGIHCRQSVGRSGMIAASLLIRSGLSVDGAVQIVRAARGLPVPETTEQLLWIEEFAANNAAVARAW